MRLQPKHKMVLNMTTYGITLGGVAGALSALVLIITSQTFAFLGGTLPVMFLEALSIAVFGMIFGGIFGMIGGLYSGIGMVVATTALFEDIASHKMFRVAMGVVTAIATALFFYTGVWHLRLQGIDTNSWNATMIMAILIAVYASQRVASMYLWEWSIRKQKAIILCHSHTAFLISCAG